MDICQLKHNQLCLRKDIKTDEKIRITEPEITSIIRVVAFIHFFQITIPLNTIDLINSSEDYLDLDSDVKVNINFGIENLVELLDYVFGKNFSAVLQRVISLHVISRPIGLALAL